MRTVRIAFRKTRSSSIPRRRSAPSSGACAGGFQRRRRPETRGSGRRRTRTRHASGPRRARRARGRRPAPGTRGAPRAARPVARAPGSRRSPETGRPRQGEPAGEPLVGRQRRAGRAHRAGAIRDRQRPPTLGGRLVALCSARGGGSKAPCAEDLAEQQPAVARGPEGDEVNGNLGLLHRAQHPRERGHVVGARLEIADRAGSSRSSHGRPRSSPWRASSRTRSGSRREMCPTRVHDLGAGRRREHPDEPLQLGRRRPRRQQLVRHVREDDEPDRRVGGDQPPERPRTDARRVVLDRERQVDDDDARPLLQQAAIARVEPARGVGRPQPAGPRPRPRVARAGRSVRTAAGRTTARRGCRSRRAST